MNDRWTASPLARSRLVAAAIVMICLLAMVAMVRLVPAGSLPGAF